MPLAFRHRHGCFKLDGRASFNYPQIVHAHRLGDRARMKVIIGFPMDLVAPNVELAFIFAIGEYVAEVEILDGYDGRAVIQNILQPLFARAKGLLYAPALFDLSQKRVVCLPMGPSFHLRSSADALPMEHENEYIEIS